MSYFNTSDGYGKYVSTAPPPPPPPSYPTAPPPPPPPSYPAAAAAPPPPPPPSYFNTSDGYGKYVSTEPPPPPPPSYPTASAAATGIPVSSVNQFYPDNRPSTPFQIHAQPQPQPQLLPQRPWSTGLCDCCSDVRSFCLTCWCPCVTFGQISEIVDKGSSSCLMQGALYTILIFTGCACLYSCCYRSKLKRSYNIQGADNCCDDCCTHFCCEGCALCQEYRELKNQGFDMSSGYHANMERLGVVIPPIVQGGMHR